MPKDAFGFLEGAIKDAKDVSEKAQAIRRTPDAGDIEKVAELLQKLADAVATIGQQLEDHLESRSPHRPGLKDRD